MEITKREVILSVTIITIMLIIGSVLSSMILDRINDKNEMYNKAIHVTDKDLFEYGMSTNVGNAFVYGDLIANEPVGYDEIDGSYMYIKKVKERYTQHSRVVSYKCGKSTCHRTEYYWTWDVVDREYKNVEDVTFLDVPFKFNQFATPFASYITTVKEGTYVRYKYYGVPSKVSGTIFANLEDNNIGSNVNIIENMDTQSAYEYMTSSYVPIYVFWFAWIIVIGFAVYGFYYLDNDWLY